MTNRGLHISLPIAHCGNELYAASINCPSPPNYKDSVFLATFLKRLSQVDVQYVRVKVGELNNTYHQGPPQTIYVRQTIPAPEVDGEFPTHAMRIRSMPSLVGCRVKTTILKSAVWSDRDSIASPRTFMGYRIKKGTNDVAAFVVFTIHNGPGVLLALGSAQRFDVAFDAFETRHPDDFTNKDFKQLDGVFEPKKPGAWVVLKDYRSRSMQSRESTAYQSWIVLKAVLLRPSIFSWISKSNACPNRLSPCKVPRTQSR